MVPTNSIKNYEISTTLYRSVETRRCHCNGCGDTRRSHRPHVCHSAKPRALEKRAHGATASAHHCDLSGELEFRLALWPVPRCKCAPTRVRHAVAVRQEH